MVSRYTTGQDRTGERGRGGEVKGDMPVVVAAAVPGVSSWPRTCRPCRAHSPCSSAHCLSSRPAARPENASSPPAPTYTQ